MTQKIDHDIPIACSLSAGDLADRKGAWRTLLDTLLVAQERVPGGLRLVVRPGAGPQLKALVDLERDCCPWITFAVDAESATMTAQDEGEEVLVQMFSLDSPLNNPDRAVHDDV